MTWEAHIGKMCTKIRSNPLTENCLQYALLNFIHTGL
jgi:hypothetical protein